MPPGSNGDGWNEWSRHILAELERLGDLATKQAECLVEIKTDIAALKVRASVWGAVGGAIAAAAVVLWQLLVK